MKEIFFDIKKFSYTEEEKADVSFIPMLMRRKLNGYGRAALYTLFNAYEGNNDINLVFSSDYGDYERVEKLISQRKEEGEVSPSGFGSSVHNATIGMFSLLNKIQTGYNSISAGEKSLSSGLLEGIMQAKEKDCLYCYTESFGGTKSVAVLISQNSEGKFRLYENFSQSGNFKDFTNFLEGKNTCFDGGIFSLEVRENAK